MRKSFQHVFLWPFPYWTKHPYRQAIYKSTVQLLKNHLCNSAKGKKIVINLANLTV